MARVWRAAFLRNTWLSVSSKNHNYKAVFVLGSRNLNSKEEYDVAMEKSRYDDLLLLPLFDSYGTLTNKVSLLHLPSPPEPQVLRALVYSHRHYRADFVLKCDDDTFVDIERVLEELHQVGVMTKPSLPSSPPPPVLIFLTSSS